MIMSIIRENQWCNKRKIMYGNLFIRLRAGGNSKVIAHFFVLWRSGNDKIQWQKHEIIDADIN